MSKRGGYGKLYGYVGKEYFLSFLVAFVFFFFIFFVNQILVLAQKILLKNVMLSDVLMLVVLSIPQFLMYTMPFSSLASASMVIGNLSSQNEVLALRSCGIHTGRIFVPIVGISLLLSISTLFIADRMIPYTTERYRDLYAQVLERVPTLELESYSSTTFGNMVISNGLVDKNEVHDMLIFDDSDPNNSRVVFADKGSFSVVDIDRFIYRIDMENPQILATDSTSLGSYSLAKASSMTMYINLSSQTGANVNITPSQMSIRQLMTLTNERREENDSLKAQKAEDVRRLTSSVAEELFSLEDGKTIDAGSLYRRVNDVVERQDRRSFSFYFQYYRTELQKKIALSFACTFLVFIAFPISFFRVKNGRLLGFGLSMLIACMYWFLLYYMHTRAIMTSLHPAIFIWFPDALVFFIGVVLLLKLRKR